MVGAATSSIQPTAVTTRLLVLCWVYDENAMLPQGPFLRLAVRRVSRALLATIIGVLLTGLVLVVTEFQGDEKLRAAEVCWIYGQGLNLDPFPTDCPPYPWPCGSSLSEPWYCSRVENDLKFPTITAWPFLLTFDL